MREKLILLFTFFFAFNLFAGDMEIKDRIIENKMVKPDIMTSSFTINAIDKNFTNVVKIMEDFVNLAKEYKNICSDTRYYITPNYKYNKDNKRSFLYYSGEINIKCKFNNVNEYETLINRANKKVNSFKEIYITLRRINWIVSEKLFEKVVKKLKQNLILTALKNATIFSETIGKKCKLKEVNYSGNSILKRYGIVSSSFAEKRISLQPPIINKKKIEISADYVLICSDER